MFRKAIGLSLVVIFLAHAPLIAQGQPATTAPARKATDKRIAWIIIGAGAGFAAGMFIGLSKFDDSINSDRKVWTSAAIGGVGGGLLSAWLTRKGSSSPQQIVNRGFGRPKSVPELCVNGFQADSGPSTRMMAAATRRQAPCSFTSSLRPALVSE
jgi:hypothetical protein